MASSLPLTRPTKSSIQSTSVGQESCRAFSLPLSNPMPRARTTVPANPWGKPRVARAPRVQALVQSPIGAPTTMREAATAITQVVLAHDVRRLEANLKRLEYKFTTALEEAQSNSEACRALSEAVHGIKIDLAAIRGYVAKTVADRSEEVGLATQQDELRSKHSGLVTVVSEIQEKTNALRQDFEVLAAAKPTLPPSAQLSPDMVTFLEDLFKKKDAILQPEPSPLASIISSNDLDGPAKVATWQSGLSPAQNASDPDSETEGVRRTISRATTVLLPSSEDDLAMPVESDTIPVPSNSTLMSECPTSRAPTEPLCRIQKEKASRCPPTQLLDASQRGYGRTSEGNGVSKRPWSTNHPRIKALQNYLNKTIDAYQSARPDSQAQFIRNFLDGMQDRQFGVHLLGRLVERFPEYAGDAGIHGATKHAGKLSDAIVMDGLRWAHVREVIGGMKITEMDWDALEM